MSWPINLKYRIPIKTGPERQLNYGWVRGWDELRYPPNKTRRGSNDIPHFDYDNLGLLFPEGNTSEKIYINIHFPHGYLIGSDIHPNVYFVQTSETLPTFKMSYRWYDAGESIPDFTTITSTGKLFEYSSGSIFQVLDFPTISGKETALMSSLMDIIIWRDDSDVSGDVLFKEFTILYQKDYIGSFYKYEK